MQVVPFRGFAERSIRFFIASLVSLSAWQALPACVSRPELTLPAQESTTAPYGCTETMCDYFYSSCVDPCAECWNICKRQDDEQSVVHCTGVCQEICSPTRTPTSRAKCDQDLGACRQTHRNTVCIDTLRDDAPQGAPPCTFNMSAANCACGHDDACLGALDRLNTKCRKCNSKWIKPCLDAACSKEADLAVACLQAQSCSSANSCAGCEAAVVALTMCFQAAQADPRDIGGCYSAPRACTSEPLCPYALY
jgi:hypothetical protein